MLSIRFPFPAVRLVRMFVAVCVCALLFIASVSPAIAGSSSPTKGEDQLMEIERKSNQVVLSDPYSFEKTAKEANKGINEVQGDADKDKMKNPSNAKATSFEQQVKNMVESITNSDDK